MNEKNVIDLTYYLKSKTKIKTYDSEDLFERKIEDNNFYIERFFAFTLDLFLVTTITNALLFVYKSFILEYFAGLSIGLKYSLLTNLSTISFPIFCLTFVTYELLALYLFSGQTLGLKILKLKVVNLDFKKEKLNEDKPYLKNIFMRLMGSFLSVLSLGLFLLIPKLKNSKESFFDLISNTSIISEDDYSSILHNREMKGEVIYIDIDSLAA